MSRNSLRRIGAGGVSIYGPNNSEDDWGSQADVTEAGAWDSDTGLGSDVGGGYPGGAQEGVGYPNAPVPYGHRGRTGSPLGLTARQRYALFVQSTGAPEVEVGSTQAYGYGGISDGGYPLASTGYLVNNNNNNNNNRKKKKKTKGSTKGKRGGATSGKNRQAQELTGGFGRLRILGE